MISNARFASRRVRRAVSRAPSRFGTPALSMRRHVLAFVVIPDSGWFTSWAIAAANICRLRATSASGSGSPRTAISRREGVEKLACRKAVAFARMSSSSTLVRPSEHVVGASFADLAGKVFSSG